MVKEWIKKEIFFSSVNAELKIKNMHQREQIRSYCYLTLSLLSNAI